VNWKEGENWELNNANVNECRQWKVKLERQVGNFYREAHQAVLGRFGGRTQKGTTNIGKTDGIAVARGAQKRCGAGGGRGVVLDTARWLGIQRNHSS